MLEAIIVCALFFVAIIGILFLLYKLDESIVDERNKRINVAIEHAWKNN